MIGYLNVASRLTPEPMLVVTVMFRLAERGCSASDAVLAQNQAAHSALVDLLVVLLNSKGFELWLQPGSSSDSHLRDDDFSMMAHPYSSGGVSNPHNAQYKI